MAELIEYEPGTAFPGKIGLTADESTPAWPRPIRAKEGAPNILFVICPEIVKLVPLFCYRSHLALLSMLLCPS